MTFKRKAILSSFSLVVVVMLAVMSLVTVLASKNFTISGGVGGSYTAINVKATMDVSYMFGADTFSAIGSQISIDTTERADDAAPAQIDMPDTLTFTKTNNFVIFKWVLVNTNTNKYPNFTASLVYKDTGSTDTNVKFTAYVGTTDIASVANIPTDAYQKTAGTNEIKITKTVPTLSGKDNLAGEPTTLYAYVKVEIPTVSNDAEFSGTFDWVLENTYVEPTV